MPLHESLLPASARGQVIPIQVVSSASLERRLGSLDKRERNWVTHAGFDASLGKICVIPSEGGDIASVLFGTGDDGASDAFAFARLSNELPDGRYRFVDIPDRAKLVSLAWVLGTYSFTRYAKKPSRKARLVLPAGVDGEDVSRIAAGMFLARDLINTPSNDMGPDELEAAARKLARTHKAKLSVTAGEALLKHDFRMIYDVGKASSRTPRLIDISWGNKGDRKLTLVGKGVCFDTGGLDLKPSNNMLLMKKDMGGAANVLGLAHMIMDSQLPVRLRVLIPAVENAVSGNAFRPGDVLRSKKGLSVEIGNTDAEGRLVLADAISEACDDRPDLIVDMATLTGAARVALGPDVPPFFTSNETLAQQLARHAEEQADPIWRLPLWRPYERMLDSKIADINNAGSGGFAGSITAALFLSRFVDEGVNWLHLDIFGWTPSARPGRPEGGEAQAIRALYALFKEMYSS